MNETSRADGATSGRPVERLLICLSLVLLVVVVYATRPASVFVLDDANNIVGNVRLHIASLSLEALSGSMIDMPSPNRPLPFVTFAIDWWRGGGSPAAFYATNVAIHAAAALVVYLFFAQVLGAAGVDGRRRDVAAGLGAALWALHPIQISAVAYPVQRMTEMAMLFALAAVVAYVAGRRAGTTGKRLGCFALALVAALLGMLSKENAWITPLLVVLAELGLVRADGAALLRHRGERLVLLGGLAFAVGVVIDIVSGSGPVSRYLAAGYAEWDFTLAQRLLTEPRVLVFHLSQILWPLPSRFSVLHDVGLSTSLMAPATTLPAILLLAAWGLAGVHLLRCPRRRLFGFLLVWPLLTLAIESSVIALDIVFEHRMYLPSVGLFGLVALLLARLPWRPALVVLGLALAGEGVASVLYLRVWSDRLAIYVNAADHAPGLFLARFNAGNALLAAGQHARAVDHYAAALAIGSPSSNKRLAGDEQASIRYNMSIALRQLGRTGEAQAALEAALQHDPRHLKALADRARMALEARDAGAAETWLRRLLAVDPGNFRALTALAEVLLGRGETNEAAQLLRQALAVDPGYARARSMLDGIAAAR